MRRTQPDEPDLRELQSVFLDDLTGRRWRTESERKSAFRSPRRGTTSDRWHVYAHGYLARIVEVLGLEYAAIRRILGDDAFEALVERYLEVFPPRSFDLARAGDRLPVFLEFDRLTVDLPFLADLARLEHTIAVSFVAADGEPAGWDALRNRSLENLLALRFGLLPGIALVRSRWPLDELWACRFEGDDDAISVALEGRPVNVLVFRRDGRVRVEGVGEAEALLLEAASCGDATLADLRELTGAGADAAGLERFVEAFRALAERNVFVIQRSTGWTGALEALKEEFS
jgi:Putative DNA-binding domain